MAARHSTTAKPEPPLLREIAKVLYVENQKPKRDNYFRDDLPPEPLKSPSEAYNRAVKPAPTEQPDPRSKRFRRPYKDKRGFRFGRLTVIDQAPWRRWRGRWFPYWVVRCDCGNVRELRGDRVNVGGRKTLSCGCLRIDRIACKDVFGQLYRRFLKDINRPKGRSKARPSCTLTRSEFEHLATSACAYCGREPHLLVRHSRGVKRNTIDRIDSFGNYVASNCAAACWPCNAMKGNLSPDQFLAQVARIAQHQRTKEDL